MRGEPSGLQLTRQTDRHCSGCCGLVAHTHTPLNHLRSSTMVCPGSRPLRYFHTMYPFVDFYQSPPGQLRSEKQFHTFIIISPFLLSRILDYFIITNQTLHNSLPSSTTHQPFFTFLPQSSGIGCMDCN